MIVFFVIYLLLSKASNTASKFLHAFLEICFLIQMLKTENEQYDV